MATAPATNTSAGTIKVVVGDVKIVGVDGVARQAQVGDRVFAKESIQTGANAIVQVQLENGRMLDLGRDSKIALDNDILGPQGPSAATPAPTGDIAALQAQIAAGADPSKVAEATAAGGAAPGAGGADGSGGSPVVVDQANSQGLVTSGFNTGPASIAFPGLQGDQFINRPPVVISLRGLVNVTEEGLEGGNPDGVGVRDRNAPGEPVVYSGQMDISDPDGQPLDVDFGIPSAILFSHGDQIIWELSNDNNTLIGYVMRAVVSGSPVRVNVLEATIDNDGNFEITLLEPIDHPLAGVEDDLDILDLELPVIATDPFGLTGSGVLELFIEDDSPIIAEGGEGGPSFPTDNILSTFSVEDSNEIIVPVRRGPMVSADEDDLRSGNHDYARGDDYPNKWTTLPVRFGADGPAEEDAIVLREDAIVDQYGNPLTSDGIELQYEWDAESRTLTGYIVRGNESYREDDGDADGDYDNRQDIFVIRVGDTSDDYVQICIELLGPLDHPLNGEGSRYDNLPEDNLIFNIGYIAKDFDGDTANGQFVVNIDDDSPTICADADDNYTRAPYHDHAHAPGMLTTQDAETRGPNNDCSESSCNFSGVFTEHHRFGADGPGAVSWDYSLRIVSQGHSHSDRRYNTDHSDHDNRVDSRLTSDGDKVYLVQLDDGTVVGYTGYHVPDCATDGNVVFSLSVNDHGEVKLIQRQEIDHDYNHDSSRPYDDQFEYLTNGLIQLVGVATVTDGDGDYTSDTVSIDMGYNVRFADDGPCIDTAACNEQSVVLSTQDPQTIGNNTDVATSDCDFSGVFKITHADFGADGPGRIEWDYSLDVTGREDRYGNVDSGLTQNGQRIYLHEMYDGTIVGSTDDDRPYYIDRDVVFSIKVDDDGHVTLKQYEELDHPIQNDPTATGAPFGDQFVALMNGLVSLTGKATITDGDGDKAYSSETIDLGNNIRFYDDGPSVGYNHQVVVEDDDLTPYGNSSDTSAPGDNYAPDNATGTLAHNYGADGAGTTKLLAATGLPDGYGFSQTLSSDGKTLMIKQDGVDVIRITLSNSTDGNYTVTQLKAINHPTLNSQSGDNTENDVTFTVNYRVTDGDGDTADGTMSVLVDDDMPIVSNITGPNSVAEDGANISGNWGASIGADQPGTVKVVVNGVEYNVGQNITVVEGTQTLGVLTVTENSGPDQWVFNPNPNIDHDFDTTFDFTIKATDKDGDTVTKTHTITVNEGANPRGGNSITLELDEEALGNANATGSNPGSTAEQDSTPTLSFTAGSDNLGAFKFSTDLHLLRVDTNAEGADELVWTRDSDTQITAHFGSAGGPLAVTLTLSAGTIPAGTTGSVTVTATLSDNLKHALGGGEQVLNLGSVDVIGSDHDGESATGTVNVTVKDDVPTAADDLLQVAPGVGNGALDVQFIVDVSGSMTSASATVPAIPGGPDFAENRLGLELYSMWQALNNNPQIQNVQFIRFDDDAQNTAWMSRSAAMDYIELSGWFVGGNVTDYDAALQAAMDAYGATRTNQTVVMFMSDGAPNDPDNNGIDGTGSGSHVSVTEWTNHVNDKGITNVFAIGIGTAAGANNLSPIALPSSNAGLADPNVRIVDDVTDVTGLTSTLNALITSVSGPVTGDVTVNDALPSGTPGADGFGSPKLVSVAYDADQNAGTPDSIYTFDATHHSFTIPLGAGRGSLLINEDGTYTFTPPVGTVDGNPFFLRYTIQDSDGDTSQAKLTINLNAPPFTDLNGVLGGDDETRTFTEQTAIMVAPAGTIGDDGDTPLASMTVTLTNRPDGAAESLSVTTALPGGFSAVYTAATGVLLITGSGSVAQYQAILQGIQYNNTSDNPNTADRTVNVVVNDGANNSVVNTSTISVVAVNDAPVITSNGGGATASISVAENTTAVTTVTSTDPEGTARVYSIVGGADAAKFQINSSTGALSFITAPNYEAPTDSGPNNIYDVIVRASDGALSDDQAIAVTVTNVAEVVAPVAVADTILTAINDGDTFAVPQWALLDNDTAGSGGPAAFGDIESFQSGANQLDDVDENDPNVDIETDNGLDANGEQATFVYSVTGGSSDATVTVKVNNESSDTVTGTSGNEIIVDNDSGNTVNAGDGRDIVFGNDGDDTLKGEGGNDILVGGDDNDTLTGGTGADTFYWHRDDISDSGVEVDIVKDFHENAGDKLQLEDLIEGGGGGQTLEALQNYLHFVADGANTVIEVKSLGNSGFGSGSVDQKIVLEGVSLATMQTTYGGVAGASDAQIISGLISANKLDMN